MNEQKALQLQRVYTIWGIVLIVWSLYRVYVKGLPEWLEELMIKPALFLGPTFIYVFFREKQTLASVGVTAGHFIRDLYLGLGIGVLFLLEGILTNMVKYGKLSLTPVMPTGQVDLLIAVVLALVSAFVEEVFVRGFLFTRLKDSYGSEVKAMVVSSIMYFLLLVPFIFVVSKLTGLNLAVFLMTNLIISFANTMIFNETKTVTVPVLIHAFWNMTVVLYL